MRPIAFVVAGHPIFFYGLFFAAGLLACTWIFRLELRRLSLPLDHAYDLVLGGTVVGLLGGKLLYLLTQLVAGKPLGTLQLLDGQGFVIAGGHIGFLTFLYGYARWRRLPFPLILDIGLLGSTLGYAIGRLGCLMTGCCYGSPTSLPWGVTYSHPLSSAPLGVSLHPTQVYDSLVSFALFGVLMLLTKRKTFEGQLVVVSIVSYAITRSLLELLRGDSVRGLFAGGALSTSQLLAIPLLIVAALFYRRFRHTPVYRGPETTAR